MRNDFMYTNSGNAPRSPWHDPVAPDEYARECRLVSTHDGDTGDRKGLFAKLLPETSLYERGQTRRG